MAVSDACADRESHRDDWATLDLVALRLCVLRATRDGPPADADQTGGTRQLHAGWRRLDAPDPGVRRLVADAARAHDAQIWTASVLSCIDQMCAHSGGHFSTGRACRIRIVTWTGGRSRTKRRIGTVEGRAN
jgi:hypothetical protein